MEKRDNNGEVNPEHDPKRKVSIYEEPSNNAYDNLGFEHSSRKVSTLKILLFSFFTEIMMFSDLNSRHRSCKKKEYSP